MGDNKVELKVASDFRKILSDLEGLNKKAAAVGEQVKRVGDELDKNLARNGKNTERNFERVRDLGRRLADQLRGYFSDLAKQTTMALEVVRKDLGLKQQFVDATKGAIDLHDTIRKIGNSLDIATDRLGDFQRNLTKAFSEAGFDADTAGRALQGIAGTQVSGEEASQAYALTAAKLAQAGGESGQEGAIAKALSEVLRTRGIDQNNLGEMNALANSVRGRNPLEKLMGQNETYMAMEPTSRGKYGPETMAGLASVRKEVGPEMDAFIRKMSQGWLEKLPASAQGLGKILGPGGINFDEVRKNSGLLRRLGKDTNASGATLGLSPEEARGLYALMKHADKAQAAQERARKRDGTLDQDVADTRGIGENVGAVKNQVTGAIGAYLAKPLGMANSVIAEASKTTGGSAALMAGTFAAATGASMLLSKLGGGKIGGAAQTGTRMAALEQLTGQKTQPVYVVNFSEIEGKLGGGLGGDAAGKLGKAADVLGKASLIMAAGAAGVELGGILNDVLDTKTKGKVDDADFEGNAVERMFFRIAEKFGRVTGTENESTKAVDRHIAREQNELKRNATATFVRTVKIDKHARKGGRGAAAAAPHDE